MTRDEIISGLEAVVRDVRKEPDEKMLGVCITADEAEEIVKLLKEKLLKEQEPIAPSVCGYKEPDGHGCWWYLCGRCKKPIDHKDRFCKRCGQAVKWD